MAYLLLTLTVLFWAGNVVIARSLHLEFPPITLAFCRWLLALLILLPFWLPRARRAMPLFKRHFGILVLLGILGVACFNTLLYLGLQSTTATNGALLQSATPVVILLICALALGEPVSGRQWFGVALSLVGVLVIISRAQFGQLFQQGFGSGDLWILAAVLAWALYSITLRWKPLELDGFTFLGFTILVAVLVLAPFMVWEQRGHQALQWNMSMVGAVVYMAVCPSILSYLFWNRGVAELGAPRAGLFIHLIPVFGMLLSVLFLDEQVYAFHLAGIALIFVGIYLAVVAKTLNRFKTRQQES
ncbi:DMT family transporter [Marinobacterium arenosum]|uniref:DMT family transporter n=1 Tax=Marinobacterium arenosum TaxID=2862496 RepID=UPI001C947858|nr:DMT family transporter [Marinobacterium arenosum]MBY4677970.1 DMT family transporter [Marinobacterium arenosum]